MLHPLFKKGFVAGLGLGLLVASVLLAVVSYPAQEGVKSCVNELLGYVGSPYYDKLISIAGASSGEYDLSALLRNIRWVAEDLRGAADFTAATVTEAALALIGLALLAAATLKR